jgi:hypothetical protein
MRVKRNGQREKAPQNGSFGELPEKDSNLHLMIQRQSRIKSKSPTKDRYCRSLATTTAGQRGHSTNSTR